MCKTLHLLGPNRPCANALLHFSDFLLNQLQGFRAVRIGRNAVCEAIALTTGSMSGMAIYHQSVRHASLHEA